MQAFLRVGFVVAAGVLAITPAFGQTTPIVNPKVVEFDPSADHSVVSATGELMVTRYDLQVFLQGTAQPFATASLGKPAPGTDGKIRVDFSTALPAWPLADGTYEARVVAVGPAGAGLSAPSNAFAFQSVAPIVPCSYSLSSSSQATSAAGGSAGVTVGASASGCAWTASSGAAWVTVSPASGTGSGSVTVTAAANTGAARTTILTIAGQSFAVSQGEAAACTYSLSPTSVTTGAVAGTGSVTLTASAPSCTWTASTATSWLILTRTGGTGSGAVGYSVAKNGTTTARTGSLTAGGQVVTVSQAAAVRPNPPKNIKVK